MESIVGGWVGRLCTSTCGTVEWRGVVWRTNAEVGVVWGGCCNWRVVIEEIIKKLSREKGMADYSNGKMERPELSLGLHTRLGL